MTMYFSTKGSSPKVKLQTGVQVGQENKMPVGGCLDELRIYNVMKNQIIENLIQR